MKQIIYQKEANYLSDYSSTVSIGFPRRNPIGTNALSKKAIVVSHKSRLAIIRINEWLTVRRVVHTIDRLYYNRQEWDETRERLSMV